MIIRDVTEYILHHGKELKSSIKVNHNDGSNEFKDAFLDELSQHIALGMKLNYEEVRSVLDYNEVCGLLERDFGTT